MSSGFRSAATRTASNRPKEFYCTVFGQMDRSQTNLAVVLRTYFYPKEIMTGAMKNVEERWDDNPSFKIICNHEVNSEPPSVMLCNPITVRAKPNSQLRIDLLNQEAFLDTREFFTDGPQLPKCLQFDVSLESYNITAGAEEQGGEDRVPSIRIIRSPDERTVATIPLVHLCDIPDAAMTGSFAFDDFCYTVDPRPRSGTTKCEHNRTWHRLPQLLVKFMSHDRELASRVMDVAKEWESHAGLQIVMVPNDSKREAQIRVKFSARNQCAIGTDAEDIPDDKPSMYLNVARDTHPVLFRRRVLHQFGHALGLYHEFLKLPSDVEWDHAGVQLDTSMEAGWTMEQTRNHVFHKETCSNNNNFDRLSIMTLPFKRSYIKGWLPRQHQSVLSVDDKVLIKHLYPPAHETHQWADPLSSPLPTGETDEEEEDSEEDSEEEDAVEWKKAADDHRELTPVDMFSGVFQDRAESMTGQTFSDQLRQPATPPGSIDREGRGRRKRGEHKIGATIQFSGEGGKKRVPTAASFFSQAGEEAAEKQVRKEYADEEDPTLADEVDIREGDFFSFRDMAAIKETERKPFDDRLPTPIVSPPDTPDSIPDSLAPTPVSKLFLTDAFMDIREEWLYATTTEAMISLTQESTPGTRKQKVQLHPGDIRFTEGGDYDAKDVRGEKIRTDTYGLSHQEKELFGERTSVVSPTELCEKEVFFRVLQSSGGRPGGDPHQDTSGDLSFAQRLAAMEKSKEKQSEFYEPSNKKHTSEIDLEKFGFGPREAPLRSKGKEKKKKGLKTLAEEGEEEETFYHRSVLRAQQKEREIEGKEKEEEFSFRDRLNSRDYKREPIKMGLGELKPVDEDIFDLLESASKHKVSRGHFIPENRAPALISTKGTFTGTAGSGMFRETRWSAYFDYTEEDMLEYGQYGDEEEEDKGPGGELFSFRELLQRKTGAAIHEGVKVTPAGYDSRNYLESPAPVANRTNDTETKIKGGIEKNKGRFYDDGVDLVSPHHLVEEALDRGFGGRQEHESDDEIKREKREAARRHYGIEGADDDVARTKEQIKRKTPTGKKSDRSTSPSDRVHGSGIPEASPTSFVSQEERLRYGFDHTITTPARLRSQEQQRYQQAGHSRGSVRSQRDQQHYYRTGTVPSSSERRERSGERFDHRRGRSGERFGHRGGSKERFDRRERSRERFERRAGSKERFERRDGSGERFERRGGSGERFERRDGSKERFERRDGSKERFERRDGSKERLERRERSGERFERRDGSKERFERRDGSKERRDPEERSKDPFDMPSLRRHASTGVSSEGPTGRLHHDPASGTSQYPHAKYYSPPAPPGKDDGLLEQFISGAKHHPGGVQHYHHGSDPHRAGPEARADQTADHHGRQFRRSPQSEVSVEADLNWNLDRTHVKTGKSGAGSKPASALFEGKDASEDSPFLPPITPKQKTKPMMSKSFVVSKEIATQITADALVPQQPYGDFWVNKDTILNRSDPYADVALRMPMSQQRFYQEESRPNTFRSTFTAATDTQENTARPQFEQLSDGEDDEQPGVYTRLSDAKAYKQSGLAVDVWAQRTDISFTVLLYLKKNLGINWKRAGQYLGVSRERLRRIEDVGIANPKSGIEKMAQDMLFEWAEKDPQPTVAKLCAALEAADLSKLSQGVFERVSKEKQPRKKRGTKKGRKKVDDPVKVPISEETIPYRVMVYLKDNLGESWKDVAVCLKMPSQRIKSIEADAWQVEKMAYDMLHEWRQREKEGATVDRLIEALERAQCKKLVKGVQARCQSYHFRVAV